MSALAAAPAANVELSATGISIPFFDANGKPTHRMAARSGVMIGGHQKLKAVEVVYFSAKDPSIVVQTVRAADAIWDEQREVLTGTGAVEITTEENRLTGTGFDFTLATGVLHLQHDFTMTNREVRLTSDRATVDLIVERKDDAVKVRDVNRCEASGNLHVVVQPTAQRTYPFEQATSHVAVYEGATQVITFPQEIRYVRKGREVTSNTLKIELGEKKPSKK